MREFFKPWRRKFGVVTLVLARVFAVAWIPGRLVSDVVKFTIGNQQILLT